MPSGFCGHSTGFPNLPSHWVFLDDFGCNSGVERVYRKLAEEKARQIEPDILSGLYLISP